MHGGGAGEQFTQNLWCKGLTARMHTTYIHFFCVKILCKGNLIRSGVTKHARDNKMLKRRLASTGGQKPLKYNNQMIGRRAVYEFELKFNVTQDMVPSCRILVYYVKTDRETVGDSIVYDVEDKLENQVTI